MNRMSAARAVIAAAVLLMPGTALAEAMWKDLKPEIFGGRTIHQAISANVVLTTPYRATDDRQVPVQVQARFTDGRMVKAVTIVIDENPMPVSMVFRFNDYRTSATVGAKMRFNGPSPIHAVVEASDGTLYMTEAYVKTSGLGACASPPVGKPDEALATLGRMDLQALPGIDAGAIDYSGQMQRAALHISHPNLTGLQMDQITLLHIPARFISHMEVSQGDDLLFTVESGISVSEDLRIEFDYRPTGADALTVYARDTDGTEFRRELAIGTGS